MITDTLLPAARQALELARRHGANAAAARAQQSRDVEFDWRDGKIEKIGDATTRGVGLSLYVDGRFSAVHTSDLRPAALDAFVKDAVALTRTLAVDPHRSLPDPKGYEGRADVDLDICDRDRESWTPDVRRRHCADLEAAARAVPGADAIVSVTTRVRDSHTATARVTTNGFEGVHETTLFTTSAEVSVKDGDRRPDNWFVASARHHGALPSPAVVGGGAAGRALAARGAKKAATETLPLLVENRVAGRLVGALCGALFGRALQQKQSFLDQRLGQVVGSKLLDLADDPLLRRGLASRLWDTDGFAARRLALFEDGVLRNFYLDDYYAKKLGAAPTTGSNSNLVWRAGNRTLDELCADAKEAILVTSFLGGNSNTTTGDFSFGIEGVRIRAGKRAEPVCEMNIAGNHKTFWQRLAMVGNDPYPYASARLPSLAFDAVVFAGA